MDPQNQKIVKKTPVKAKAQPTSNQPNTGGGSQPEIWDGNNEGWTYVKNKRGKRK